MKRAAKSEPAKLKPAIERLGEIQRLSDVLRVRYIGWMSGSKQHFIPQSLLKGFGFNKGKSTFVVAYTHDRGIFTPATDGIAAERHFYSELRVAGGDETLDDQITYYETPLATVLAELRALGDGEEADPRKAAEFVTHLAIRNDNFRKAVTSAGTAMVEGVADQFADTASARKLLGLDGDTIEGSFAEQLAEAFDQYRPLIAMMGIEEATFRQWAFLTVKANFDTYYAETREQMDEALATIVQSMPGVAADAQRKSLGETLAPAQRVEHMTAFTWRVVHIAGLILPDCVAIAYDPNGLASPLMLASIDTLASIFAPLSSERLLVGSRTGVVSVPADFNEAFAGCSWDFFVARERTPELEVLRDTLRSRATSYLEDLVDGAISEAVGDRGART